MSTAAGASRRDSAAVSWLVERSGAVVLIAATAVIAAVPVYFVFEQALTDGASGLRQLVQQPGFGSRAPPGSARSTRSPGWSISTGPCSTSGPVSSAAGSSNGSP